MNLLSKLLIKCYVVRKKTGVIPPIKTHLAEMPGPTWPVITSHLLLCAKGQLAAYSLSFLSCGSTESPGCGQGLQVRRWLHVVAYELSGDLKEGR